ncbi:hypothetical protein [Natronospira bacteriovora]|uniref:Tetratricopeptide repeat protein n=1 Tax=Natronospira bacteriovora TaxID=3069753 RepID=A0ABU0WAL6_9GAMM|nr:hypothetical protein [Natronospira sp. AB-CW4]MDQ2070813.1 hypothetical protein [Natronospira sp. AB-CW4]
MALLDDENRIPRVWERLPRIFAYPFHSACLTSLGLFALLYGVGIFLPLIGFLLVLVAYVGLYKFAADCLEATARGWMEPPEIQSANTSWMLAKQFLLLFGLILLVVAVAIATGSMLLTALVGLAVGFAWPAAIMIVVMTNSLLYALNPLAWFNVIRRIGWAYFIAVLLLMMLSLSQTMAEGLMAWLAGYGWLGAVGLFLVGGYFLIASFHLMGYLVYENHEALGVEVDGEGVDKRREGKQVSVPATPALQEAEERIRQGDTDGAIAHLRTTLNQGGLPEEHERYRKLLSLQGRKEELLEHGREYISILLYGHEDEKKAMLVMKECLQLDPNFRPKEARTVLDLAQVMDRFADHESVIKLTNGFAQQHPKHPDVAENYYLAARALWFGRGKDEQALKILGQLIRRFPEHEKRGEMERLASQISEGPLTSPKPKPA